MSIFLYTALTTAAVVAATAVSLRNSRKNSKVLKTSIQNKKRHCLLIFSQNDMQFELDTADIFNSSTLLSSESFKLLSVNYDKIHILCKNMSKNFYKQLILFLQTHKVNNLFIDDEFVPFLQGLKNIPKPKLLVEELVLFSKTVEDSNFRQIKKLLNNNRNIESFRKLKFSFLDCVKLLLDGTNNFLEISDKELFLDNTGGESSQFSTLTVDLSNSNMLKSFNNLPINRNIDVYWKKGNCIVNISETSVPQFRRVLNSESSVIDFDQLPLSVSSVLNNNFYADNEVLKEDIGLEDKVDINLIFWVKIINFVETVTVDYKTGDTTSLNEDNIYFSRLRKIFATKKVDDKYYAILNQNKEPEYNTNVFSITSTLPEVTTEETDDWVLFENVPDISIPSSKKSVIMFDIGNGISIPVGHSINADLSYLHYCLCQHLERYRNNFQSYPGFNNEIGFFGDTTSRFKPYL